jgi:streptogramin lyase
MLPFRHLTAVAAVLCLCGPIHSQVLLVTYPSSNTVSSFSAVTGASLNPTFIAPVADGGSMALDGSNHLFVSSGSTAGANTVGEFNATTGATINAAFIGGNTPEGLAVDGSNHLFVANLHSNEVSEYNATTGAVINLSFITNGSFNLAPAALALDAGGRLFVAQGNGSVGVYDAASGAAINTGFVTIPSRSPGGLAVDGNNHLFVSDLSGTTVDEFDATTGAAINQITGLSHPTGLDLDGSNHLFVVNSFSGSIGEYDATTLAPINPTFISSLTLGPPSALSFVPAAVPEPSSLILVGVAVIAGGMARVRRKRRTPT